MTLNNLNKQIDIQLKKLGGDVALMVKFLNTKKEIKVNRDFQFWAASVIKIPISCEFFRQVNEGKIKPETKTKIKAENRVEGSGVFKLLNKDDEFTYLDLVTLMLDISDNAGTNEIVDIIGWENVEKYMHQLGLLNTTFRHKMMIKAGRGPNFTTAQDITMLLEKLYNNEIPGAAQILSILKQQQDRRRIPLLLPNDIEISNKTGSLEKAVHDAGIIYSKNPFIFVFLSDDQEDKILTNEVLSNCAKLCFDYSIS